MQTLLLLMCLKLSPCLNTFLNRCLWPLRILTKNVSNPQYMRIFCFLCKKMIASDIFITLQTLRLRILVLITNTPTSSKANIFQIQYHFTENPFFKKVFVCVSQVGLLREHFWEREGAGGKCTTNLAEPSSDLLLRVPSSSIFMKSSLVKMYFRDFMQRELFVIKSSHTHTRTRKDL